MAGRNKSNSIEDRPVPEGSAEQTAEKNLADPVRPQT